MAKAITFSLRPDQFQDFKDILELVKSQKEALNLDRDQLQALGSVRDNMDRAYFSSQNTRDSKSDLMPTNLTEHY